MAEAVVPERGRTEDGEIQCSVGLRCRALVSRSVKA